MFLRSALPLLLALISLRIAAPPAFSQGALAWQQEYFTEYNDDIAAVDIDPAGNVSLAASEYRDDRFHVLVAKHASVDGALVWETRREAVEGQSETPAAIKFTPAGNVLVASIISPFGASGQVAVTQYDGASGEIQWSKLFPVAVDATRANLSLAVDESGAIAVGASGHPASSLKLWVAKLEPGGGDPLWERKITASSAKTSRLLDLAFTGAGDLIVAGDHAWTGAGAFTAAKFSGGNGDTLWDVALPLAPQTREFPAAMKVDPSGNLLISGSTQPQWNVSMICTVKVSGQDGSEMWRSVSESRGQANHIACDLSGNAYITGAKLPADFGSPNRFTARLNGADGAVDWERVDVPQFHSAAGEAIFVDGAGNVIVGGRCAQLSFDPYQIQKLSAASGELIWQKNVPDFLGVPTHTRPGSHRRAAVSAGGIVAAAENVFGNPRVRVAKVIENVSPQTHLATAIGQRSATLRATVTTTESGVPEVQWELGAWGGPLPPIGTPMGPVSGIGPFEFELQVDDLEPGAYYFFRPKATVNGIIAYGSIAWFRTVPDGRPEITLLGESPMVTERGQPYIEPGATAIDPEDGPVPVTITGTVNTNAFGVYTITYKATDSVNKTTTVTRSVTVADTTPPVVTVGGPRTVDAGLPLMSFIPVTVLSELAASRTQDPPAGTPAPAGVFTVTISARDFSGNVGSTTITVTGLPAIASTSLHRRGDLVTADGVPAGAFWKTFGIPSAGNGDRLAFQGTYAAAGKTIRGIFADRGEGLALLSKVGDPALGADGSPLGDASIAAFRDPLMDHEGNVVVVPGRMRGTGITSSNDEGLWSVHGDGEMRLIAREGDLAHGPDGAPMASGARIQRITSVLIPASQAGGETVFFSARLRDGSPAVVSANNAGIWAAAGGAPPRLLLRKGDFLFTPSGMRAVTNFTIFSGSAGTLGAMRAFSEDGTEAGVRVSLSDGSQRLLVLRAAGEFDAQLATGSSVPGTPQFTLGKFGVPASWGASFTAAATLQRAPGNGVTALNDYCVFNEAGIVAREGAAAPGIAGTTFKSFRDPILLAADRSAFRARVTPAETQSDDGIWAQDWNGELHLIAQEGTVAPDLRFAPFRLFNNVAGASDATSVGVAFTARLTQGSFTGGNVFNAPETVTSSNDLGLWALNHAGELRLIARTGTILPASGQNPPVSLHGLRSIAFLGSVIGSPGQARGYISPRSILYRVTFADGAQAIVRSAIP